MRHPVLKKRKFWCPCGNSRNPSRNTLEALGDPVRGAISQHRLSKQPGVSHKLRHVSNFKLLKKATFDICVFTLPRKHSFQWLYIQLESLRHFTMFRRSSLQYLRPTHPTIAEKRMSNYGFISYSLDKIYIFIQYICNYYVYILFINVFNWNEPF